MSNRPYKNVKRFMDDTSREVAKAMKGESAIEIVKLPDDTDLLGKLASELMSSFEVNGNTITATLPYVEGYTGFSGDVSEQEGNYLAFKVTSKMKSATLQVKTSTSTYTLDSDGIIILLIKKATGTITIISKTDTLNLSKKYSLNLTLEPKHE